MGTGDGHRPADHPGTAAGRLDGGESVDNTCLQEVREQVGAGSTPRPTCWVEQGHDQTDGEDRAVRVEVGRTLRWAAALADLLKRRLEELPRPHAAYLDLAVTPTPMAATLVASGAGLGKVTVTFTERGLSVHMVRAPDDDDKHFHMDLNMVDDSSAEVLGIATTVFNLLVWGDLEAPSAVDRLAEIVP
jgi:hypothetical protein